MWLYTWHWLRPTLYEWDPQILQSGHLDQQQPQVEAVEQSRAPIAFQTNGQIVRISSTGNKISGYFWHKLWFHQPKDFTQKMVSPAKRRRFIGEKCYCGGKIVFESGSGSGWTWDWQRMGFAEGISGIPVVLSKIMLLSLVIEHTHTQDWF